MKTVEQLEAALTAERERVRELEGRFRAPIVCICGSTRFKQTWIIENARLTGEGNIVLSVGLWGHHERKFPDDKTKLFLDELHKRKIDLCDWIWVLDVGGYIGESTRSEIDYALRKLKIVRYLSHEFPDYIEPIDPLKKAEAEANELRERIGNWETVDKDHKRLVRELDELLNGKEGMAQQASLCDIVAQVASIQRTAIEQAGGEGEINNSTKKTYSTARPLGRLE